MNRIASRFSDEKLEILIQHEIMDVSFISSICLMAVGCWLLAGTFIWKFSVWVRIIRPKLLPSATLDLFSPYQMDFIFFVRFHALWWYRQQCLCIRDKNKILSTKSYPVIHVQCSWVWKCMSFGYGAMAGVWNNNE